PDLFTTSPSGENLLLLAEDFIKDAEELNRKPKNYLVKMRRRLRQANLILKYLAGQSNISLESVGRCEFKTALKLTKENLDKVRRILEEKQKEKLSYGAALEQLEQEWSDRLRLSYIYSLMKKLGDTVWIDWPFRPYQEKISSQLDKGRLITGPFGIKLVRLLEADLVNRTRTAKEFLDTYNPKQEFSQYINPKEQKHIKEETARSQVWQAEYWQEGMAGLPIYPADLSDFKDWYFPEGARFEDIENWCGGRRNIKHSGLDFAFYRSVDNQVRLIPIGTPVRAVASGRVVGSPLGKSTFARYDANVLTISHNEQNALYSIYAHIEQIGLMVGDWVEQGQVVGFLASDGSLDRNSQNYLAPHLHLGLVCDLEEKKEGSSDKKDNEYWSPKSFRNPQAIIKMHSSSTLSCEFQNDHKRSTDIFGSFVSNTSSTRGIDVTSKFTLELECNVQDISVAERLLGRIQAFDARLHFFKSDYSTELTRNLSLLEGQKIKGKDFREYSIKAILRGEAVKLSVLGDRNEEAGFILLWQEQPDTIEIIDAEFGNSTFGQNTDCQKKGLYKELLKKIIELNPQVGTLISLISHEETLQVISKNLNENNILDGGLLTNSPLVCARNKLGFLRHRAIFCEGDFGKKFIILESNKRESTTQSIANIEPLTIRSWGDAAVSQISVAPGVCGVNLPLGLEEKLLQNYPPSGDILISPAKIIVFIGCGYGTEMEPDSQNQNNFIIGLNPESAIEAKRKKTGYLTGLANVKIIPQRVQDWQAQELEGKVDEINLIYPNCWILSREADQICPKVGYLLKEGAEVFIATEVRFSGFPKMIAAFNKFVAKMQEAGLSIVSDEELAFDQVPEKVQKAGCHYISELYQAQNPDYKVAIIRLRKQEKKEDKGVAQEGSLTDTQDCRINGTSLEGKFFNGGTDNNNASSKRQNQTELKRQPLFTYSARNLKHLIIHACQDFDHELFAKEAIERIMQRICTAGGSNLEIIGLEVQTNEGPVEASYLDHKERRLGMNEEDIEEIVKFILDAEELILSGGNYAGSSYGECHWKWYLMLLATRTGKGKRTILHFPLDAIYPRSKEKKFLPISIRDNKYVQVLEEPSHFDLLLEKGITEAIPYCIFYNGELIWKNSDSPQVIINYWDSYQMLVGEVLTEKPNWQNIFRNTNPIKVDIG
ncbi:MAG: M23 family metallopeptidase, partial [Candidatus Omnitrophica bacterium]|nr:M23 family metallopeptidase [Candidatus Omnitrophota bacterium]